MPADMRTLRQALEAAEGYHGAQEEEAEMMPKDAPGIRFSWRTFMMYTGSGWLMSLAYLDPGNLESDLQSGAYTGYNLLWVLFACTLAGLMLQILAARLGVVTGKNLAQTCREHYSRKTSLVIWVMTEIAIIGSDIQEVLGSSIALKELFGWPLWLGSVITGLDTFTFLMIHYFGKRMLEVFIFLLIMLMMGSFFVNWAIDVPPADEMLEGFLPTCPTYAVLQLVGTIGAVIMPHNIFLHSALVQSRGVDRRDQDHVRQANKYLFVDSAVALAVSFLINAALLTAFANGFFDTACAENTSTPLACIYHATKPSSECSGAACGPCGLGGEGMCGEIGLDNAGTALVALFSTRRGKLARIVFALGVLAAGQASTMTGTFAGQFVMEGFLEWRIPIWQRTLLTRGVALGPAVGVALLTTSRPNLNNNVNEWLNILQSVQLPFTLLPLLHFNADQELMGTRFALQRRWQTACWLLAALVIAANVILVANQAAGSPTWIWAPLIAGLAIYLFILSVIIRTELKAVWVFLRGLCGGRSEAADQARQSTSAELVTNSHTEDGAGRG